MKKSLARAAAAARGDKTYVPEQPCVRGHSLRSIRGTCIECRKLRDKARYYADPEKTKALTKRKYHQNAEKIRTKRRDAYVKNSDVEKELARRRSAIWRANNPAHPGAIAAKAYWKRRNPAKVLAYTMKRRAAQAQRTPAWLTPDDLWLLEQAYELAAQRTRVFGFSWHVDHVLPLHGKYVSGLHVPTNVQVIPGTANVAKANKYLPA